MVLKQRILLVFTQTTFTVIHLTLVAVDLRDDSLLLRPTGVAHLRHGPVANVHRLKHLLDLVHLEIVPQAGNSVLGDRRQLPAGRTRQLAGLGSALVLVGVEVAL